MTSKDIREKFLDFFASKNHQILPSAPMVVKDDPTLMFTNAGMNQFKDWFLGNTPIKHRRVADTQKCLRVSGKHNDLEEVGHDSYHHTMFEMLGNWSFGDYFKKEAIEWAWELLTQVYGLDKDRLYVTIFEGSKDDKVELDQEAKDLWLQFLPEDRIILGNKKDNFWEMGDTGPCGPCSEIHIDLRSDEDRARISGAEMVNVGDPLVVEIWNLVFIQYQRKSNGTLEALPAKHIDTGLGLERLVMAINGNTSNYDSELFQNIIAKIAAMSGKKYNESEDVAIAMRVIADHLRAISFSIADGQLPSNVKAGYVIRRILRRAVRYGYTFLGFDSPFICRLVSTLANEMGEAFPELIKQQTLIEKVIKEEEESFLRTLDKGIRVMDGILEKTKDTKMISGKDAFTLYDTFGFPLDLSELIAKENGYSIDLKEFKLELGKQKDRARNAAIVEEGDWIEVSKTESLDFVGYDNYESDIHLVKYRTVKSKNKESFQLIFNRSPFYAESGGQTGDSGYIISASGEKIQILNTVKENTLSIHIAERLPLNPKEVFKAVIDREKREEIASNHTATHLLHHALREKLGSHIEQKGSYVNSDYFRFDFSHFEKVSEEVLSEIEKLINKVIRQDIPRDEFRNIPMDEAKMMGAIALFGEKYDDSVRVIRFGDSIELCGGTHASSTGNLGMFKIIAESSVAAGIRRIEATTGRHVEAMFDNMDGQIKMIRSIFGNTPNILGSIQKVMAENESFRKALDEATKERTVSFKKAIVEEGKIVNGIRVFMTRNTLRADILKDIAFELYKEFETAIFVAACETIEGKANLVLMYTDDLVKNGADASKDIQEAAKLIDGGGGGQKFLATAGGKNINGLSDALDFMIEKATKS